jgi:putative heme iron utilization protein
MNETENLAEKAESLQSLLASQQTLLLSTSSTAGIPDLGYAPFVQDKTGCFYIFVSELATHTTNLQNNPRASVMFIRAESESSNLFARERAIFDCQCREVDQCEPLYSTQLKALQDKFGEVVSLLRTLNDFHLFALSPENGRYILGFGQAYSINTEDGSLFPVNRKNR